MHRILVAGFFALVGCAAPARDYGYSRSYVATPEETQAIRECRTDLSPRDLCQDFSRWHGAQFSWFGVITDLDAARNGSEDGWVVLRLSHRPHVEPHRCAENTDETTCRVTIDVHEDGVFSARVQLRQDDWTGPLRVRVGSLLRIVGTPALNGCHGEDGPFFDSTWYRHWPHGFYTTTSGGDHAAGT